MKDNKAPFSTLIRDSDIPVLVDFYADWCGPCKSMEPVVQDLASEFSAKLRVIKVDVEKNQNAASQYGVQGVPTFVLFHKGDIVWRKSGALPPQQLKAEVSQHL